MAKVLIAGGGEGRDAVGALDSGKKRGFGQSVDAVLRAFICTQTWKRKRL